MTTTVGLREANQDFSGLVDRVVLTGQGVVVTRRGVPVVRIEPVLPEAGGLTPEREALLARLLDGKLELAPWPFDRDALYDDV
jgi:prevent-host-death family protein